MVIVASVALSTMISNDLVLPALWRWRGAAAADRHGVAGGDPADDAASRSSACC
jgi:hypothetical protein